MYGGAISGNTTNDTGGGVYIVSGGTFTMYGGAISGNTAANGGGGIYSVGTFEMYGGKILSNSADVMGGGGGVYNTSNGVFTMSGGEISSNTAGGDGGGVYNTSGKTFTISGGKISNNTAGSNGGGIYNGGKLTMDSGTVSGNTSSFGNGGGVYNSGTFTMGSGTISQNTARSGGGVYTNNGTFTIDGTVNITSNTSGGNVYLYNGKTITIGDNFNASSNVGVSTSKIPKCNSPVIITETTKDVSSNFSSDNTAYKIAYEDNVLKLTADHSYSTAYSNNETDHWYECSVCHVHKDEATHTWESNGTQTNPTLTDKGSKSLKCSTCQYTKTEEIPSLSDPTWKKVGFTTEPTLTAAGSYKYTSDDYGDVTVSVPALSNATEWTKGGFITEPTLEDDGTYKYTSSTYGKVEVTVPKLTDSSIWTKDEGQHVDPTEDADGKDVYTSTEYGSVTVILTQLSHTHIWGDWTITTDPTLSDTGEAIRVCTKDRSHTETKTVPALSDTTEWTKSGFIAKPTLSAEGTFKYTSPTYGEVEVAVPNLTDSIWTKVEEESTEPTETDQGKYVYNSTEYGKVEVTIPELNHTHTLTKVEGKPATETEAGIKEHWHCSGCNKNFSDENGTTEIADITIPVLEHTHTLTKVESTPATETETGIVEHWHCSGCNKNFSDENGTIEITDITIPELGHTHTLTKVEGKPATETETGIKEHWKCSGCGKLFSDENGNTVIVESDTVIPATGSTGDPVEPSDSVQPSDPAEPSVPVEPSTPEETSKPDGTSKPGETSNPDVSGNKSKEVKVSENVPKTMIATPLDELIDAVISEEKLAQITDSDNVKIVLKIEDAEETVSDEDKQAIEEVLEQLDNFKLAQHLDVSLFMVINNNETKITSTNKPITVTFEIPETLRGSDREFEVIRIHENETTVLYDLDDDENTVTIETDSFSAYALAYTEKTSQNPATGIKVICPTVMLCAAAVAVIAKRRKL